MVNLWSSVASETGIEIRNMFGLGSDSYKAKESALPIDLPQVSLSRSSSEMRYVLQTNKITCGLLVACAQLRKSKIMQPASEHDWPNVLIHFHQN